MDLTLLDRYALRGRWLLSGSDAVDAHYDYDEWCDDVAGWLARIAPGSGLGAEWCTLGSSPLLLDGVDRVDTDAWAGFRNQVNERIRWLAGLPKRPGVSLGTSDVGHTPTLHLPADFDRSIFLNCPFDDDFRPLRDAAVFTLVFLGLHVRCALDTADGSRVRIEKLFDLIRSSRLGLHDLSRVELDAVHGLPRFNMPLELGIFLGVKDSGGPAQMRKKALITGSAPYEYQKYISDVAGQDVLPHSDDPEQLSGVIRDWVAGLRDDHLPSRSRIWERYRHFRGELESRCREARQSTNELTYRDFLRHVDDFCASTDDQLVVCTGQPVVNPSRSQIASTIRSLPGGDDSFAILAKAGRRLTYMQTAGGGNEGFVLEMQEGSTDAHFVCATPDLDADGVIRALVLYSEDDPAWRTEFRWEPMDLFSRSA